MTERAKRRLESWSLQRFLLWFTIIANLLGVFATVGYFHNNDHLNKVTACLATYNNTNNAVQKIRANLNTEQITLTQDENAAVANLIETVSAAGGDTDVKKKAFSWYHIQNQRFQLRAAEIDRERSATPIPPPPSEVCK